MLGDQSKLLVFHPQKFVSMTVIVAGSSASGHRYSPSNQASCDQPNECIMMALLTARAMVWRETLESANCGVYLELSRTSAASWSHFW